MKPPRSAPPPPPDFARAPPPAGPLPRWGLMLVLVGSLIAASGNGALIFAAAVLFRHAPPTADLLTRAEAGTLFGALLHGWLLAVSFVFLPVVVLGVMKLCHHARRTVTALVVIGVLFALLAITMQLADAVRLARVPPPPPALPMPPERFALLHGLSEASFAGLTLVLCALAIWAGVLLTRSQSLAPTAAPLRRVA